MLQMWTKFVATVLFAGLYTFCNMLNTFRFSSNKTLHRYHQTNLVVFFQQNQGRLRKISSLNEFQFLLRNDCTLSLLTSIRLGYLCFRLDNKVHFDTQNIWSMQRSVPRITRTIVKSIVSRFLVIVKSIKCNFLEPERLLYVFSAATLYL